MFCPSCGSEERQASQYCRACGTDLRPVRVSIERPDSITASAVSAREEIGRAVAEKIREVEDSGDLKRVAEDVLPQIEKFLESPEEKRLRRVRAGVVTAASGLGASVLIFLVSMQAHDLIPFIALGLVAFFVGLGLIINGLIFTVPRKGIADRSEEARAQRELESRMQNPPGAYQLSDAFPQMTNGSKATDPLAGRPSVTEHTTQHLRPDKS